ncbi:MAG: NGG1p interacting factor NIF3 [Elusimicrobia bacterium]|nr:NGG1p interacting factor NIF3 [Elusimicrobiota bacterium]
MKLKDLFTFCIEQGIAQDLRGKDAVLAEQKRKNERFAKLPADEKEDFDTDTLTNPFADSRILFGDPETEVKTILTGIDIETAEIVLAHTLKTIGKPVDLVITHHPEGKAYATFYQVMGLQSDVLNKFGVPITAAESLTDDRMKEVGRKVMGQNHMRTVDAARLLGIPFMSAHTVADNHVASYLQNVCDEKKPVFIGEIIKLLKAIPEYKEATGNGAGPTILSGSKDNKAGKIFVDMTGGTEGAKEAIEKLADAGVGTMICMHMSDDHFKMAEKCHIRVIIAGHIASDNLGVNLLFDSVEKKFGPLNFLECSGFRRIRRAQ